MGKAKSPGQLLAEMRWRDTTEEDRQAVGAMLAESRKSIPRAKRKEIAKNAAQARWAKAKLQESSKAGKKELSKGRAATKTKKSGLD